MTTHHRRVRPTFVAGTIALALALTPLAASAEIGHIQGAMAGEATAGSVILQSRLTALSIDDSGDVPGAAGVGRFELADTPQFKKAVLTPWIEALPENDYMIKTRVDSLLPGTTYYYRLVFGPNREAARPGPTSSFATLPGRQAAAATSFVVVTGMNYAFFHQGTDGKGKRAYQGDDKSLGYPALAAIGSLNPDFLIGTGDNVYYDHPRADSATTPEAMRKKWHEQFVQPRFVELFSHVPTYWEKDDHDHRYNDNDNSGDRPPSSELGIRIFREQVPVVDPADPDALTYRTHRISRLLQIWLVEGRDYRSQNRAPDGPDKTLWGKDQIEWLKRTLLESDAPVKMLISPTPLVGPDDGYKKDNHTNLGGFRHEGQAFLAWAKQQGLDRRGLFILCGDRHWQYHSVHPLGFEEFSCGALVDANSRLGVRPGGKRGTDLEAQVRQLYTSAEPSGGFLNVVVEPAGDGAKVRFDFRDENGALLHRVETER